VRARLVAALLFSLLAAGCGGSESAQSGPDASARVACEHFRNVAGDVAAGILTDEELRAKVKEVYSAASVTKEPGMADAARQLLSAATEGDPDRLLLNFQLFDAECDEAGL
jgi:hypothetical protein